MVYSSSSLPRSLNTNGNCLRWYSTLNSSLGCVLFYHKVNGIHVPYHVRFKLLIGWFCSSFAIEQCASLLRHTGRQLALGNKILIVNSWDLHGEDRFGRGIKKETAVEKAIGKGLLYHSLSPAVLPTSFVRAGTTPSRSCDQPSCWSEAAFASTLSDYAPDAV